MDDGKTVEINVPRVAAFINHLVGQHDRLVAMLREWASVLVVCPGCMKEHLSGHEDSCACDHCGRAALPTQRLLEEVK